MRTDHRRVTISGLIGIIFFIALVLTIFGCGRGGGGGTVVTPESALQGRFLDGPVGGLEYRAVKWSGITDADGTFTFQKGDTITFYLGNVTLGQSIAKSIITPVDIVPGAFDSTHPVVVNISQLLQSLDQDGNPANGITITEEMRGVLREYTVDYTDPEFADNPDVERLFNALNDMGIYPEEDDRSLISAEDAQLHLKDTLDVIEAEAIEAEEALLNMPFSAFIEKPSSHVILVQGQSMNFQGSVIAGAEPYTYLWDFGDDERFFQRQDPGTLSFNTPGTYEVLFTVMDANGETQNDYRLVTVLDKTVYGPIPTGDEQAMSYILGPHTTTMRTGQTLNLKAVIEKGNPPFRYSWGYDNSTIYSFDQDPLDAQFTFTTPGSHIISFYIKDAVNGDTWYNQLVYDIEDSSE